MQRLICLIQFLSKDREDEVAYPSIFKELHGDALVIHPRTNWEPGPSAPSIYNGTRVYFTGNSAKLLATAVAFQNRHRDSFLFATYDPAYPDRCSAWAIYPYAEVNDKLLAIPENDPGFLTTFQGEQLTAFSLAADLLLKE